MPMILLVLMNLTVGISALLLTYRIFEFKGFADSAIAFFILFFSQIVFSELILGLTGILSVTYLFFINLGFCVCIVFILLMKTRGMFQLSRENRAPLDYVREGLALNKTVLFLLSLVLGFALVKISINLVNPPFGWDDLNYHFTFPVEWLKHGNLENPITVFDDPSPSYYPINGSLFFFWLMAPLRSVFLADLGQLPFFIIAFLAVYSISKKVGIDRGMSFIAAALFLLIPNFFKQLKIAYVDVLVAALFLSALVYLFRLRKDFSFKEVLIFSLSLGLLAGTKTLALLYGLILFLPLLFFCFKNPGRIHLGIVSVVLIIAAGGFTYIRNFLQTHNPLYPLDFYAFGNHLFKGVIPPGLYRIHFLAKDFRLTKLLFHEGLGAQTLIFILPSVFLGLPVTLLKKKPLTFELVYFLLLPLLIYGVYRYLIPLPNSRYLYPLLGVGMVVGLYVVTLVSVPAFIVNALAVLCSLASIPELARKTELIVSLALTGLIFLLILNVRKRPLPERLKIPPLIVVCVLTGLAVGLVFLEKDYCAKEYRRYIRMEKYSGFWPDATRAWAWLNSNTRADNIAYAGRPVPFPLYGTRFKNNVYYVSVNTTEPARLHDFPDSYYHWDAEFTSLHKNLEANGNYRFGADYAAWVYNLRKKQVDFLFVYSLHQTKELAFPLEDEWARNHPGNFTQVFINETVHIYKVLR